MDFQIFETGKRYRAFLGLNGAKLYEQDGNLFLVVSYDDVQDEEVDAFGHAPFELVFKTFGLISLFTFTFHDHIVDAPFNQFAKYMEPLTEITFICLVFEASTGELITRRKSALPKSFCASFAKLLSERYAEYSDRYNLEAFNEGIKEIYDNHVIDELYELPGDREIRCVVRDEMDR